MARLFADDNPVAMRQPRTDRLVIERFLQHDAHGLALQNTARIDNAHAVILRWADLETSGQLARMNENQLQGEFLRDIFATALGYTLFSEGLGSWTLEQHRSVAGQQPEALLGQFRAGHEPNPLAVVELKGPRIHLDRDRSAGRTAVQQAWEYLVNTPPDCRWAIVSNMVSFRLYERGSTPRRYEHFSLQSLRDRATFTQFLTLLAADRFILKAPNQPTATEQLLARSVNRQREVGDELYETYSNNRLKLIGHLHHTLGHDLDPAIEMAQRLLDRVIFIAFCEDRQLLNPNTLKTAYESLPGFSEVTNPRWQNFKNLFRFIDRGSATHDIPPYNGGLFANHPADDLELDDEPWTNFFHTLGRYNFADEVNLDVLGHLFERSITELEKLREGGLFGGDAQKAEQYAQMPQSAKRKQMGVYYTPSELTSRIVEYTVGDLIHDRLSTLAIEHAIAPDAAKRGDAPDTLAYWQQALAIMRNLKIVDPACGSGAFLFQAYEVLEHRYAEIIEHLKRLNHPDADDLARQIPQFILQENLYGVDLSREAVEITQLALWIRSATRGQTLATLSRNIVHGNSLVHDPQAHPDGFDWHERFGEVFRRANQSEPGCVSPVPEHRCDTHRLALENGFDCVIGNPPWERIKLQEREFFSLPAPEIATATNAAKRRKLVAAMETENPELHARYIAAQKASESLLTWCRKSGHYPLTGKGDINTYAVFAELASRLVAPNGRVGLIVPSGIASDMTTKDFFADIAENNQLIRLFDFENRTKQFFPDVDGRFKFCILNFGGAAMRVADAKFVFFAHSVEELDDPTRRVSLSGDDIKLLNPNTRTCPIFRSRRDAEITKAIYRRVPVLIDKNRRGKTGNPWGLSFLRIFDQAIDAHQFTTAEELFAKGFRQDQNLWIKGRSKYVPCYEAKMAQAYDHRAASVRFENNWARQGQPTPSSISERMNPEYLPLPRWWAKDEAITKALGSRTSAALAAFRKVTSPTNSRTLLVNFMPPYGAIDSIQLFIFDAASMLRRCCFVANCNSFALDYVLRQKIGNVNVNYFLVEQLPFFGPDTYDRRCPWDGRVTLERWVSERVLKLTCTAEDMLPLAEACDFSSGSFREYEGRLHKWNEEDRAQLMAELDAAYFILYGIDREDAGYILSTFNGIHEPSPLFAGVSRADHILDTMDHLLAGGGD